MNKGRIMLAGVLAGIVVFIWGAVAHMALGLGESAMKAIPNETEVLSTMQKNITGPGFYFYPGGMLVAGSLPKEQQEAAMKKAEEDYKTLPHGVLILTPPNGAPLSMGKPLAVELATNILGGIIAAWLLSLAIGVLPSFIGRVIFVAALGFFAPLAIDASYWNWYGFPGAYLLSSFIDSTVGWGLAGVVLAAMIKPR